jgi:hypothetical protein
MPGRLTVSMPGVPRGSPHDLARARHGQSSGLAWLARTFLPQRRAQRLPVDHGYFGEQPLLGWAGSSRHIRD